MLLLVALALPEVLLLPRGYLLGWGSALIRAFVLLVPLALGWSLYQLVTSVVKTPLIKCE
jgi:hypothetical protein